MKAKATRLKVALMSGRAGVRGGGVGQGEVIESQGARKNLWGRTGKKSNTVCKRPVWDAYGMGCCTLASREWQLS